MQKFYNSCVYYPELAINIYRLIGRFRKDAFEMINIPKHLMRAYHLQCCSQELLVSRGESLISLITTLGMLATLYANGSIQFVVQSLICIIVQCTFL